MQLPLLQYCHHHHYYRLPTIVSASAITTATAAATSTATSTVASTATLPLPLQGTWKFNFSACPNFSLKNFPKSFHLPFRKVEGEIH